MATALRRRSFLFIPDLLRSVIPVVGLPETPCLGCETKRVKGTVFLLGFGDAITGDIASDLLLSR